MKRKRAIVWGAIVVLFATALKLLYEGITYENSLVVVFSAVLSTVAGNTALLMWLSR